MDPKAAALSTARKKIVSLQAQMTNQMLAMASAVDALLEQSTPREARAFLRVTCGLSSADLSTYVRFARTLKGSEDVLRAGRVSLSVVKSLVAADDEARLEALKTIAGGGRLDTKDVSAIRRKVRLARLEPQEAAANARLAEVKAAARKVAAKSAALLDVSLRQLVLDLDDLANRQWAIDSEGHVAGEDKEFVRRYEIVKASGAAALAEFESVYGRDHKTPSKVIKLGGSLVEWRLAKASLMLRRVADGRFAHNGGYSGDNKQHSTAFRGMIDALFALTGERDYVRQYHKPRHAVTKGLKEPPVRLTSLELCAGAGGLALGLEAAGFEPCALVEMNPDAVSTLKANRPEWNVIQKDLTKMDFRHYTGGVDVLSGGPPCQPYSSDGNGAGETDERDLFKHMPKVVAQVRPRAFVFENVFGFNFDKYAAYRARIFSNFAELGYAVTMFGMDSKDFGIAQERPRVFVVGMAPEAMASFRIPPTFDQWRATLGDALEDLMGEGGWSGAAAWAQARRDQIIVRNGIPEKGALISTIKAHEAGVGQFKEEGRALARQFALGRSRDNPPTEAEAASAGPNFRPGLTIRMKKRLMGFPDDHVLVGDKASQAAQLGNAVVPRVGQAVGLAVYSALEGVEFDWEVALRNPKMSHENGDGRRRSVDAPPLDYLDTVYELESVQ